MTRHSDCAFAGTVVNSLKIPLVVLTAGFRVKTANKAFCDEYHWKPFEVETRSFLDIFTDGKSLSALHTALEQIAVGKIESQCIELDANLTRTGDRVLCIDLRSIFSVSANLILLSIEDITRRKHAELDAITHQKELKRLVALSERKLDQISQMLQNEAVVRAEVQSALHASESALFRSREELRDLSASLLNAQDAERRRVSRELHDDLSQKVARLQFDLETLVQKLPFQDVQSAREEMRHVIERTGTLSDDLRRVAHQLHPATLDLLGLSVALRSYTDEFSRSTAIPVKFTGISVPRNLPIEVASGLYRIVQEALRNVGKHASDAKVEIVLARDSKGLALFIRDNGEGFNAEEVRAKGGLGLISIAERVRLMQGKFSVESSLGYGVLLTILCPLPGGIS